MSAIVDRLTPNALLPLNKPFAATNEREGSEIATQIVRTLLRFLRAERLPDGTRTFRLREGRPLETGFGIDLYRRIFGVAQGTQPEEAAPPAPAAPDRETLTAAGESKTPSLRPPNRLRPS